ncbi:MutS-related protein [Silvibacterium acidisoli]|uniref:MutS-related protein n=1 Tax=Acidobacteriaceae bacterium ZG23-2 TaxID=2883246 RepID=UPI00406D1E2A
MEPRAEYQQRLASLEAETVRLQLGDRRYVIAKIIACVIQFAAAVWLVRYDRAHLYLCLILLIAFIVIFFLHEKLLRKKRLQERVSRFYARGLARVNGQWAGTGSAGDRFLDPEHPYARDLDLFGAGGLFELLCSARTRSGEETLAAWLLHPASAQEAEARQQAITELAPMLDFREKLVIAGEDLTHSGHSQSFAAWAESNERFNPMFARVIAPALTVVWLLSLIAWWLKDWGAAALAMSFINLAFNYRYRTQVAHSLAPMEEATSELGLLAAIFKLLEQQSFTSEKLRSLQQRLSAAGCCPSRALAVLEKRVDWLESNDNWFVKIIAPFVFWAPQWIGAIENWRTRYGASVRDWLLVIGEFEALSSLSTFAFENPGYVFATFAPEGPRLEIESFTHPLLPREKAVANDLRLDARLQMLLISGPNMAGKSTFMRGIGVNVVLAMAGASVAARRMELSPLSVTASICILDSLQGGLSRFYAEIMRLKKIDDLSHEAVPVLFLLDELLSGTNSHDRRVATASLLRSLISRGAIGLVTTHDLALTRIAEEMNGSAANYHFGDTFKDGQLHFDYRLTPGVVQTTNALELMRSIGIDV